MKRVLAALLVLLGLSQQAFALANCSGTTTASAKYAYSTSSVQGVVIMNNSANLMCISFDGVAATGGTNCASGSFPLAPGAATTAGGSFMSPPGFNPSAISIVSSAGAGDTYSCYRW